MIRIALNVIWVVVLTTLTQLGGLAWLGALFFRRRLVAFVAFYAVLSVGAIFVAPLFGRVPLPCLGDGSLRAQSVAYCVLNRNYVVPTVREVAADLASEMARSFPGTETLYLDAEFPFVDGFPLLPHLSHTDGRKLDLALFYRDGQTYLPGVTRSPIGYFAFEPGSTDCSDQWPTLRWNLDWLQPLMRPLDLDEDRMRHALQWLADKPVVSRVFLEPHLVGRLGVHAAKIRFQGCRAARHDDHLHFEVAG